jgi:predicted SnoaL-like aldol condensation-catalyzing enzyme
MSPEENKAIVRHYIEAVWNEGDMQTVDDVVVPDFVQHVGMVNQGREGIHRFFAMVRAAFPDIRNTVEDALADGDKVPDDHGHNAARSACATHHKTVRFLAMNIIACTTIALSKTGASKTRVGPCSNWSNASATSATLPARRAAGPLSSR